MPIGWNATRPKPEKISNSFPEIFAFSIPYPPTRTSCSPLVPLAYAGAASPSAAGEHKELGKMELPELMTMADFCNRYSLGKTSAYREVAKGRLRLRKFGTATRIARRDAEIWAESLPVVEGGAK